jgi:hypothetical protein
MQFTFSESEFQGRCEQAQAAYAGTVQSASTPGIKGAILQEMVQDATIGAERYHELRKAGYTTLPETSPLQSFSAIGYMVTLFLVKPQKLQKAELEEVFAQVRADYGQELEVQYQAEIERQIDFALAAAQRKAEKEATDAESAIAEQVRKDMTEARDLLRKKLVEEGKLTAEGIAK